MPWNIKAEGAAWDARAEQLLIDRLRLVLTTASAGCDYVEMHSEHHGAVNLLDTTGIAIDESGI